MMTFLTAAAEKPNPHTTRNRMRKKTFVDSRHHLPSQTQKRNDRELRGTRRKRRGTQRRLDHAEAEEGGEQSASYARLKRDGCAPRVTCCVSHCACTCCAFVSETHERMNE